MPPVRILCENHSLWVNLPLFQLVCTSIIFPKYISFYQDFGIRSTYSWYVTCHNIWWVVIICLWHRYSLLMPKFSSEILLCIISIWIMQRFHCSHQLTPSLMPPCLINCPLNLSVWNDSILSLLMIQMYSINITGQVAQMKFIDVHIYFRGDNSSIQKSPFCVCRI